ncbi:MAG: hypothetical protein K6T63_11470 [Alicyclobacillus herbarius]|uniref:hypothetical protein n=1 Tax=Alicyclobacillus herbarius TaxID=122960 RepID=UPI00235555A0|nr:hypothetical protein [Alicyclobacillus herbarius]MCL6633236.1 hypothetical protein [Alicyclobacillus herbarius]
MFRFIRRAQITLHDIDNVMWYGKKQDRPGGVTQWADPDFYRIWEEAMQEAFDLLGMMDRYQAFLQEPNGGETLTSGCDGLIPVPGPKNRHLLRNALFNIDQVTTALKSIPVVDGNVIRHSGEKSKALDQWRTITELIGQTTVMAIVTPGLRYYVQGTQVGYTPTTKHLFRRSNTLERVGVPNQPHWRANISGHVVEIVGNWDEIKKARKKMGYNIFQMLQLRLNEELEKAVRKGK